MTITGNFIGGKTVISSSNETMPVYDPATGKAVREVTVSAAQEVSEAIQVARDAFDSWSRTRRCACTCCQLQNVAGAAWKSWRGSSSASTVRCGRMRWAS